MSPLTQRVPPCRPHNRLNNKLRLILLSLLRGLQLPLLLVCLARWWLSHQSINYKWYLQTLQRPLAVATLLVLFLSTSDLVTYSASTHLPLNQVLLQKRQEQLVVRQRSIVRCKGYFPFVTNIACPIFLSKLFPAAIGAFSPALQSFRPPYGLLVQSRRQKNCRLGQQGQQHAVTAARNAAKPGKDSKKQVREGHALPLNSSLYAASVYINQHEMQLRRRSTTGASLAGFLPPSLCSSFSHSKVEAAATNFAAAADCAVSKSNFYSFSANGNAQSCSTVGDCLSSSSSGQIISSMRSATVAAPGAGYCLAKYIETDTVPVASSLLLCNNWCNSSCQRLFSNNNNEGGKQGDVSGKCVRRIVRKDVNSAAPAAGEVAESPARESVTTSAAHIKGVDLNKWDGENGKTPRQLRLDRIQPHVNRRFQYHRSPASRRRVLRCFPPPPLKRRMLLRPRDAAASSATDTESGAAEREKQQQQKTQHQVPPVSAAETQPGQTSSRSRISHITTPEEDQFTPPPQPVSAFNWPPGCYLRIQYSGGRADDVDEAGRRIIAAVAAAGKDFVCSFPARLPTIRKRFSLAKSPFKHRTAIEQFQLVQRRRIIDVHVKKELQQAELRGERGERRWGRMPWPSRENRHAVAVVETPFPDEATAASNASAIATREAWKPGVATAAGAAALGAHSGCSSKLAERAEETVCLAAASGAPAAGGKDTWKEEHLGKNEAANEEDGVCAVTVPHWKRTNKKSDVALTEATHNFPSTIKAPQHNDYGSSSSESGKGSGSSGGGDAAGDSSLGVRSSERRAVVASQRETDGSNDRTSSCVQSSDRICNSSAGVIVHGEKAVTGLLAVILPEQVQYSLRYEPYKLPQKAREIYGQLQYKKKWISKYFEYQQNMQEKEVLIAELLSEKYEYDRLVTWPESFHDLRSYTALQIKKMLRIAENHYRERLSRRRRNLPVYRPRLKFFGDFRLPPEDEVVAGDPYARMPPSAEYKLEEKSKQGRLSSPQKAMKKVKREKTSKGKKRAKKG